MYNTELDSSTIDTILSFLIVLPIVIVAFYAADFTPKSFARENSSILTFPTSPLVSSKTSVSAL